MVREPRKSIQCTLKHHLGKLRESEKGWSREVNIISWEGAQSRLDIRDWSKSKDRSSKGITFTRAEVERLREMLAILDISVIEDSGAPMKVQEVQVSYQPSPQADTETTPVLAQAQTSSEDSEQTDEFPFDVEDVSDEQRQAV